MVSFELVSRMPQTNFFFLAEVAALKRAQEVAASSSSHVLDRIPCPAKIGNLRAAMRLGDDDAKYPSFRVRFFFFFFVAHTVTESHYRLIFDS